MQHEAQTLLVSWTPSRKSVKFDRRLKYLAVPEQEATRSHVISARLSENSTSHVTHGKGFIWRDGCIVAQSEIGENTGLKIHDGKVS